MIIDIIIEKVFEMEYKNLKSSIVLLSDDIYTELQKELRLMRAYTYIPTNEINDQYIQIMNHKLEIVKCLGTQRLELYSDGSKCL